MRRGKRRHQEDVHENHERWLISFADYMTLLFALFVVLYAFAQNEKGEAENMVENLMESLRQEGMISSVPGSALFDGGIGITGSASTTDSSVLIVGEKHTEDLYSREDSTSDVFQYSDTDFKSDPSSVTAFESVRLALQSEIDSGDIETEQFGQQLVIRIAAPLAFPRDSQFLQPSFRPLVKKIALSIQDIPGMITVSGHTNLSPPTSELYRDNWELSSLRAVSVANLLVKYADISPNRLQVVGAGASALLVNEESVTNDRVEVSISQGKPSYSLLAAF
ncbi:OmpA family protein [Enterovibrio sp. ZSDZ35]|uniref:OmpA family protein n=1 Tax=Enterovibrio qingdaonensis TaxID=2899818 RepID=A0ABT5QGS5_9GAMM|nr:flagellar motor protein MotB [Enterovibrio sp. ZSDZ35]MDD1780157.1 OmpA family protein [Enterovibrio sp. ZSDZ35]